MSNLMAFRESILTNGVSTNGSATMDPTDHAEILRGLFGVRANVTQLYDHFSRRSQHQLTRFARSFSSGTLAASCDQIDASTADQIQTACVAYDAQAKDLQTTVTTLGAVLDRVDREIELRVNLCGDEARCIISDELLKTNSELLVADATLGQKQAWVKRLQDLSVKAENPAPVPQAGQFGNARFGEYRPDAAVVASHELFREESPSHEFVREEVLETRAAPVATTKPRAKR